MLQHRSEIMSHAFLQAAVEDYLVQFNRESLVRLTMQIHLDLFGFFHRRYRHRSAAGTNDRNPERTAFERIMLAGPKKSGSVLKHAIGFLCELVVNKINPIIACHGVDNRALDLCISILNNAINAGLLFRDDYLSFYTSAIELLYSGANNRHREIFYLLTHLKIESATPLSIVIKYFPAQLVRPVFLIINDMYFTHKDFSREGYCRILTTPDFYGLTPLHYAIRRRHPTALTDLYAAMSLTLKHDEHIQFHHQNLDNNNFVDWIAFYGTLTILNGYIAFLTENLNAPAMMSIMMQQARVNHQLRVRYDHDTDLSQALIRILQPQALKPANRNIFNFKLFSFPHIPCDGVDTRRTRNTVKI